MIKKKPRGGSAVPFWQKTAGIVIIGEVLLFGGTYFVWNKLNGDRGFRKTSQVNYPWILEKYYQLGELLDSNSNIRGQDQAIWKAEDSFQAKQSKLNTSQLN